MQKVIRTYPDKYMPSKIKYPNGGFTSNGKLDIALTKGCRVIMCNPIYFSDGGMCLEYIVEEDENYTDLFSDIKQYLPENEQLEDWLERLAADLSFHLINRADVMDYLREKETEYIIKRSKEESSNCTDNICNDPTSVINEFINFIVQCPPTYQTDTVIEHILKKVREIKELTPEQSLSEKL